MPADALKKLHTALIDTRKGYEEALRDTKDSGVAKMCKDMIALREADHQDLHHALLAAGEKPDDKGSFMTTVHETVISVRSAITGVGKNAIGAFVMGEKNIIKEYDAAIDEAATADAVKILTRQKAKLETKIAEMKALEADGAKA